MSDIVPGGLGEPKPADAEIQKICDKVKPDVEREVGMSFSTFQAKCYRSQVVAGTNYFIKVYVGGSCIHIRVFQPLPHTGSTLELIAVQLGKTEADPIEYFS